MPIYWLIMNYNFSDKNIKILPDYVKNAKQINCSYNNIKVLPFMVKLNHLDCESNKIRKLPKLADAAYTIIDCGFNRIKFLQYYNNIYFDNLEECNKLKDYSRSINCIFIFPEKEGIKQINNNNYLNFIIYNTSKPNIDYV